VTDDWSEQRLGEYEIALRRRNAAPILFDRSAPALLKEIKILLNEVEPLASYQAGPILKLLVEYTAERKIPPQFPQITVLFVSLMGFFEAIDPQCPTQEQPILEQFNQIFARIEAMVRAQSGVLQRVTYHPEGSDCLIYFGTPNAHSNDVVRGLLTACAIRELLGTWPTLTVGDQAIQFGCQVGIAHGPVFAAEIGESRGRREYNILGDTVNTAARLMSQAHPQQILLTEGVWRALSQQPRHNQSLFRLTSLGKRSVKGKSAALEIYDLHRATIDP
jgi:class 3 adenylate cyclase